MIKPGKICWKQNGGRDDWRRGGGERFRIGFSNWSSFLTINKWQENSPYKAGRGAP